MSARSPCSPATTLATLALSACGGTAVSTGRAAPTASAAATPRSFFALGAGGNVIWMDPEDDIIVVVRWLDTSQVNEFMRRVLAAVGSG